MDKNNEDIDHLRDKFNLLQVDSENTHPALLDNGTQLKLEINELIWRNASSKTTLAQAEEMAVTLWSEIMDTHIQENY